MLWLIARKKFEQIIDLLRNALARYFGMSERLPRFLSLACMFPWVRTGGQGGDTLDGREQLLTACFPMKYLDTPCYFPQNMACMLVHALYVPISKNIFFYHFEMLHMSHFHGLNMFEFKSVQRVFGWDQNVVSIYAAMLFRVGTCAWECFQKNPR